MKTNIAITVALYAIVVLLCFNLVAMLLEPISAQAQKDSGITGKYQITAWALSTGGTTHYTGYYVLDTVTGKITDKYTELHKQGEFDVPPR